MELIQLPFLLLQLVVVRVALNTTLLMVTTQRVQAVQVVVDRGAIPQVNMLAAMAQRAKVIKVEITSPTVVSVPAVVVLGLRVEIQLALQQVQVVQEKHPSLREQLSLVVAVDRFVLEAILQEPVVQAVQVAVAQVHHLDLQNQMQQVVRNPEQQILVAVVVLAFSRALQRTVKVHKAVQALWLSAG
jgi:hypothetical protein